VQYCSVKVVDRRQFESDLRSIAAVEEYIDCLRQDYCIDDAVYGNMLLAVVEAMTNAIEHGNAFDISKKVTFEVRKGTKHLSFLIKDQGLGFNPAEVPDPTLPANLEEPRGRGVFLIQNLADAVRFEDNGSCVNMDFLLNGS
jgi:serine/threonine-protein kinase RsbW